MVSIKKAAEVTGVSEHTLRAWERRYGLVSTARTTSGYRDYDDTDLGRIRRMRDLVEAGWAPRDAAAEVVRLGSFAESAEGQARLLAAAADLDADGVARLVEEEFARDTFETVVDRWLMPTLVLLGRAWADGTVSVAGEHLVTSIVRARLASAYEQEAGSTRGQPVLIGAPPGVDHELGLLAFATAARRAGVHTVYLGAQVPAEAWRVAVDKVRARAVVSSLHRRADAARLVPVAEALAEAPHVELWVGGRHQQQAPHPFRPLGHSIAAASARLAHRHSGTSPS
jgi:DNA-binding transcriptional MerR regulator/methylmalonyl-CoA mutase cobalamin-binding subunit